ncbi:Ankyrin repeat domain-containing protein 55 [Balamuthia mandrillaris]
MSFAHDLPEELSVHVFSFLTSPRDLCNAAAAHSAWKRLAGDPALWRGVFCRLCRVEEPCKGLLLRQQQQEGEFDWKLAASKQRDIYNAILESMKETNLAAFKENLAKEFEINMKDEDGRTLLHHLLIVATSRVQHTGLLVRLFAVEQAQMHALLDKGIDINAKCNRGRTALHYAVDGNYLAVIELLVNLGASMSIVDNEGKTPRRVAVELGWSQVLRFFDSKIPNAPLCGAAKEKDLKRVIQLIEEEKYDVEQMDQNGKTALHWAAEKSDAEITKYLLDKGANLAARNKQGQTPPHYAAYMGCVPVFKVMLEHSGNDIINWRNDNRETVLHYACHWNRVALVELLLSLGADCTATDRWKNTPCHHLAVAGNTQLLHSVLLTAKKKKEDGGEKTKATNGEDDVYRTLLQKNVDNETPLDIAVNSKNEPMVEYIRNALRSKNMLE